MDKQILNVIAEQRQEIEGLRAWKAQAEATFGTIAQLLKGHPENQDGAILSEALAALISRLQRQYNEAVGIKVTKTYPPEHPDSASVEASNGSNTNAHSNGSAVSQLAGVQD